MTRAGATAISFAITQRKVIWVGLKLIGLKNTTPIVSDLPVDATSTRKGWFNRCVGDPGQENGLDVNLQVFGYCESCSAWNDRVKLIVPTLPIWTTVGLQSPLKQQLSYSISGCHGLQRFAAGEYDSPLIVTQYRVLSAGSIGVVR